MRQYLSLPIVATALTLAACGPGQVVVTAEIEVQDPETGGTVTRSVEDLEIWLIPFDRDVVFDSLATAAAEPEPEIPPEILAAQEEVAQAQQAWLEADARWNALRDTLTKLNEEIARYNRGEPRYIELFRQFNELEAQLRTVERRQQQAFQRYDSLSKANIQRAQEVSMQRQNWADDAFADVNDVFLAKVRAAGRPMMADTTDASGVVAFRVQPGQYWVHARHEGLFTELYWNVPVEVARGDPVQVHLTRANGEERPKL